MDKDMKFFIEDAIKFVTTFFQPISHSAPHIYLSALPMLPSDSLIAKTYSCHFTRVVSLERGNKGHGHLSTVSCKGTLEVSPL